MYSLAHTKALHLSPVWGAHGPYRRVKHRPFDRLRHRPQEPIPQPAQERARKLADPLGHIGYEGQETHAAAAGGVQRVNGGTDETSLRDGGEGGEGCGVPRQAGVEGAVEQSRVFHGGARAWVMRWWVG